MSVQLNWLRTFVTVYRLGSFTKAAHKLGISQPAVTHQIRNLEKEMGRPLFIRLPHGAQPTPAADGLLREVQAPVDALGAAVARSMGEEVTHRPLYIGGPVELTTTRLIPSVSDLVAEGMQFRFRFGLAEELLDCLAAGELDLVLSTIRPRSRSIGATPLVDEEFVLLASAELAARLPLDRLATDGPSVLADVPLISYAESLPIIRRYWRTIFGKQHTAHAAVAVPNLYAVLSAVNAGAGYSVLPRSLCQDHLDSGRLTLLHDPEEPPLNTLFLLQRPGAEANPDVLRVRERLREAAHAW